MLRPQRQDARQPDAALLAAAQLVRVEVEVGAGQADRGEDRAHLLLALGPGQRACGSSAARAASGRTFQRGSSEAPGSW